MKIRVKRNSSQFVIVFRKNGLILIFAHGKVPLAQNLHSTRIYNARHYDPRIARFVTADTVIDGEDSTQGWNRYSYVKGNPVVAKDPTGHFELDDNITNESDLGKFEIQTGVVEKSDAKEGLSGIAANLIGLKSKNNATKKEQEQIKQIVKDLVEINGLKDANKIYPGQKIITKLAFTPAKSQEKELGISISISTTNQLTDKAAGKNKGISISNELAFSKKKGAIYRKKITPIEGLVDAGVSLLIGISDPNAYKTVNISVGPFTASKDYNKKGKITALRIGIGVGFPFGVSQSDDSREEFVEEYITKRSMNNESSNYCKGVCK